MKDWDYSVLTHNANLHGGPEKYIEAIKKHAYQEAVEATSQRWLKPTLFLAPFTATGIFIVTQKAATKIKHLL